MEFVAFGALFLLLMIIGTAIYRSDMDGWNATFKRLSRFTRASLESGKDVKLLEKLPEKDAHDAWTAAYEGEPQTAVEPVKSELNHELVKLDYYSSYGGEKWPRWTCKCGSKGYTPTINGLKWAQDNAKKDAATHVRSQNEAEEFLRKSDGKFAF